MKVTVAFPFRPGNEWRARSFSKVRQSYAAVLRGAEQIIVDTKHDAFNRAAARNECVRRASDGVVVIADADILPNRGALLSAVSAAARGGLHLGYNYYRALNLESTERFFIRGGNPDALPMSHDSVDSTAGIMVIRTDEWWCAGGMDERFHKWGFEDSAFACAARTLLGPLTYHEGTVNHLWHPSEVRMKSESYQQNKVLYGRYAAAEGDVPAMRLILNEDGRQ